MRDLSHWQNGLRWWRHCRLCCSQLSAPVCSLSGGGAFCSSICHIRFYHTRCIVCERPWRGAGSICGKRQCRRVLRRAAP